MYYFIINNVVVEVLECTEEYALEYSKALAVSKQLSVVIARMAHRCDFISPVKVTSF